MGDKKTMAGLVLFAGQNLVENLSFIPADKWNWKPAPEAKSAQEIVNHVLENFAMFNGYFGGTGFEPVNDIDSAKAGLHQATRDYAANLHSATPEQLDEILDLGSMKLPLSQLASMAVIDLLNHHGQITYIQSLLGDSESHFDMSAFAHVS